MRKVIQTSLAAACFAVAPVLTGTAMAQKIYHLPFLPTVFCAVWPRAPHTVECASLKSSNSRMPMIIKIPLDRLSVSQQKAFAKEPHVYCKAETRGGRLVGFSFPCRIAVMTE